MLSMDQIYVLPNGIDKIRICYFNNTCADIYTGISFPGTHNQPPLTVYGSQFYVQLVIDSANIRWLPQGNWGYYISLIANVYSKSGWTCLNNFPPQASIGLFIVKLTLVERIDSLLYNELCRFWTGLTCIEGLITGRNI